MIILSFKKDLSYAFIKSIPIMLSYEFLSIAFGIMMHNAGFSVVWAYLVSLTVYTGAFQFVLVSFLSAGASLVTVVLTALAMNSRHMFYGVTFIDKFKSMGKKYPYMIFSLTDETYALNCSLNIPDGLKEKNVLFFIALLARIYWLTGTAIGALLGQFIPFDFEGIDFCMTALFITIFIDQWRKADNHLPAVTGLVSSVIFLLLLGADNFILPALVCATGILVFAGNAQEDGEVSHDKD